MSDEKSKLEGPDLAQGVRVSTLAEGAMLRGHAKGEPVILVRRGAELFAIGSVCTHYGGPLAEGLLVGETVRCPWHHACFSLRTGEALRAPALNPVSCWRVEQRDGRAFVRERLKSADESVPYDRPNLSKNYLAGSAPEEWIPLRSSEFYREHDIDLKLGVRVGGIDTANRQLEVMDGSRHTYDALLLATGAEPVRLALPGGDLPHVHYLRTLADSRALVATARASKQAVVIGASFIGLEVAASLRARNIGVHVIGRETCPMEKVLGAEVGNFIRRLHEEHGVIFHLGTTAAAIDAHSVTLASGEKIAADLVVIGIGVRPAIALAERAGLAVDRGVTVDEYLQTSVPGIYAAGDIARWPDRLTGERIRVEHWVLAQRQGQAAARNILGRRERFDAVPFFWTEQYDWGLAYVGHAERFDTVQIDGQLEARDCTIVFRRGGRKLAVATIHRDLEGLKAEVELERAIAWKSQSAAAASP
jgi:NADPH-dependent 2,4-dienoyl-CoA reductase/sulfur reductase-like enzyme